jgi:hypothetical protein
MGWCDQLDGGPEEVGVGDVPPAPRFPHGGSFGPSLAVVPLIRTAAAPVLSCDGDRAAPVASGCEGGSGVEGFSTSFVSSAPISLTR